MSETKRFSTSANPWLGTLLAIIAALVTVGFMRARYPMFVVSSEYDIGMGASVEARLALQQQTQAAERKNAMTIFALGGCLLAAGLAVVADACCGLPIRIVSGLVWGAIWGALTGWSAAQAQTIFIPAGSLPSVTNIGTTQAFTFGLLGAGVGLMFGGFTRNTRQALTSAITATIAGGGGGFLYAVIVGFVADAKSSAQLIPASALAQLLWLALPMTAIAFLLSQPKPLHGDAVTEEVNEA